MSSQSTLIPRGHELLHRRSRIDKVRIGWARPTPYDRWHQPEGDYACTDATGRKRKVHEFIVLTRRGMACCFCGTVEKA